jgi:tricorn protease
MLRDPDVSADHIAFRYADDLWAVARDGGVATPLASPEDAELTSRFSPDGSRLAFVAHYEDDPEIYTMPIAGRVLLRVTHRPGRQQRCDWANDEEPLYYAAARNGLLARTEIFRVNTDGGMPRALPVPYGAEAALESTGRFLAYSPIRTRWIGVWKHYVGGSASDIWLLDMDEASLRQLTEWEGSDVAPMWHEGSLYSPSDAGSAHRRNIWSLNPRSGERRQLTRHTDADVGTPAIGPGPEGNGEVVYTYCEELRLLDPGTGASRAVMVRVPGARAPPSPGPRRRVRGDRPCERGAGRQARRRRGAWRRLDPSRGARRASQPDADERRGGTLSGLEPGWSPRCGLLGPLRRV